MNYLTVIAIVLISAIGAQAYFNQHEHLFKTKLFNNAKTGNKPRSILTGVIEQRVDHFNVQDNRTWAQV